ncbi:MAG: 50S ribosomal protein L9 [Chloroflexota bacterium]
MKVIFIEDVPDVALAGETKVVADGYGRNYLLPKKLAVLANSAASNVVEVQLKRVAVKRAQVAVEMGELAKKLEGTEIKLKARVGEKDRLYGSITASDIAQALSQSVGQEIDKRKIVLEEPIRQVGTHDVTLSFTHDIEAVIKVTVEAEKVAEEKPEKEEKKPRARKKAAEAEAVVEEAGAKVEEAEAGAGIEAVAEAAEEEEEEKEARE